MSAYLLRADMLGGSIDVRKVPLADSPGLRFGVIMDLRF
jgi:hypothetical protein